MPLSKGQRLRPTFIRAKIAGTLHAVHPSEIEVYPNIRTLCGLVVQYDNIIQQRFQADILSRRVCAACTNQADILRPQINRERETRRRKQIREAKKSGRP
jgi:hypothetical protein